MLNVLTMKLLIFALILLKSSLVNRKKYFKGTVTVITNDIPCNDGNARFLLQILLQEKNY